MVGQLAYPLHEGLCLIAMLWIIALLKYPACTWLLYCFTHILALSHPMNVSCLFAPKR